MDDQPNPHHAALQDVFPQLHDAQRAWLSQIDSLKAPDRKTHELVRLALAAVLGSEGGVERHARLAREVGATWDEVLGTIMLTLPGFGVLRAVQAVPWAQAGFDAAAPTETDDDA